MVRSALNMFPSDFRDGRYDIKASGPPPQVLTPVDIHDARPMQAATTAAELFERSAFALLPHVTAVTDWDADLRVTYESELAGLVAHQLFPGRRLRVSPGWLLRRGVGTYNDRYTPGVHQDCGLTVDDFQNHKTFLRTPENQQRWRVTYDSDEVEGFTLINFWRTTNMAGPLMHMPLALCEPNSIAPAEIVHFSMMRGDPGMGLRFNEAQRWYYYSRMTVDEVLAFKLFQRRKNDDGVSLCSAFHGAFALPDAPADVERRQSCEYRLPVWLLRD